MKQHINPSLSLKHFRDDNGMVWTYHKENGKRSPAIPDETGIEAHYYSVERPDGSMDTTLEKYFSEIESDAAPVYEAVARFDMPTGSDRDTFGAFLGMMYVRSPASRQMALDIHKGTLEAVLKLACDEPRVLEWHNETRKADGKPPVDPVLLANNMRDLSRLNLKLAKPLALMPIELLGKFAKLFLAMEWALLRAERGFFITCDSPIVQTSDLKTHHPIYGDGGMKNPTSDITFPISPKVMLLMHWGKGKQSAGTMSRELVRRENHKRAYSAARQIYSHVADDGTSKLVAKYKGQRPGIIYSGAVPEKGFASVSTPRRWSGK